MVQAVIAKQFLALYWSERSYNIILYNVFPSFTFLESLLVKDPIFSKEDAYVCDRKHQYERSCEKGLRMLELHKEYNITNEDDIRMLNRYIIFWLNYSGFYCLVNIIKLLCYSELCLKQTPLQWPELISRAWEKPCPIVPLGQVDFLAGKVNFKAYFRDG